MSGVAGVFVGVAASAAFSKVLGWPTIIPPGAVLLSLVFSATLGVFFGMYPARQAARLNPIEALRYE
jgi:putative ABC transport system permease protein